MLSVPTKSKLLNGLLLELLAVDILELLLLELPLLLKLTIDFLTCRFSVLHLPINFWKAVLLTATSTSFKSLAFSGLLPSFLTGSPSVLDPKRSFKQIGLLSIEQ